MPQNQPSHHHTYKKTTITWLSIFFVMALWIGFECFKSQFETGPEEGSARLMSLGTPKVMAPPKDGRALVLFNDASVSKNWGLAAQGSANIKATHAWSITRGSRKVMVAIIDTGIDASHSDLKNNLWTNVGEIGKDTRGRDKSNNGIDDDENGYVDDVHGWNFVNNSNDLTDNHGHGTHVAGIVGAEGTDGKGVTGVSPLVSLMILKYYDPKAGGQDNLRNTVRAIQYATKMHANIINYSGGGLDFSQEEHDAVKGARDHGILFVAAAGNERSNSDVKHYYPADYDLDNIISVTAVNPSGHVLQSSNFGEQSVHIAAPGESIFSTLPGNHYGMMTGTSQATAFVTGVAALIIANNDEFKYDRVKKQIISTADQTLDLLGKSQSAGILNSWAALAKQPSIPASGVIVAEPSTLPQAGGTARTASVNSSVGEQLTSLSGLLKDFRTPADKAN